jgi:periplasmic divalent cation tolerance protein
MTHPEMSSAGETPATPRTATADADHERPVPSADERPDAAPRATHRASRSLSAPRALPPPMPHTDAIVVMTTLASTDEAVKLVRALLERRLVACGTVLPGGRSLYRWQGKIADEQEAVVLLKTRSARLETLQLAFAELHPYKVPELLALPVTAGNVKYLEWINGETTLALA